MRAIPFVLFWVVLLAGRKELGWKGVLVFVAVWMAFLFAVLASRLDFHFFVAAESILDVVLLSTVYIGFTRLR